jgi:hypothetical protein
MRNTADVTGGKPIAVLLQSISGISAINPLVAFYEHHRRNGEVLFFYSVPDTTRDLFIKGSANIKKSQTTLLPKKESNNKILHRYNSN